MKAHQAALPLFIASLVVAVAPASADLLDGTVLAYDRVASVLVMKDKSVVPLDNFTGEMPSDLAAGDMIEVSYASDEDGISEVYSITKME